METQEDAVGRSIENDAGDGMVMDYTSNGDGEINKDGDGDWIMGGLDEGQGENDNGNVNSRPQSIPIEQSHQSPPYTGNPRSVLGNVDDIEAGREGGEMPGVGSGQVLTVVVWSWVWTGLDGGGLELVLLVRIGLEQIDIIDMHRIGRPG